MDSTFPLSQLPVGQCATVQQILTAGTMRRRLQDLGIILGTPIECVLKSPAGDPVAYRIRGALIALRKKDSETILMNL